MVLSDVVSAALWIAIIRIRSPVGLLAIGFVATVVGALYRIGSEAALPVLAGETDLTKANSTVQTAFSLASIAGPPAGSFTGPSVRVLPSP